MNNIIKLNFDFNKYNLKGGNKYNIETFLEKFNNKEILEGFYLKKIKFQIKLTKSNENKKYVEYHNLVKNMKIFAEFIRKLRKLKLLQFVYSKILTTDNFCRGITEDCNIIKYLNNVYQIHNKKKLIIYYKKDFHISTKDRKDLDVVSLSKNLKINEFNLDTLIKVKSKYKLIFIDYRNHNIERSNQNWLLHQFKYYLKIIKWSLKNLDKEGIIVLNLGPPIFSFIKDFFCLMSKYSSTFIYSNYIFKELDQIPVFYCFSNFWKVNELIEDLNKIEKINFDNNNSFLTYDFQFR